MRNTIRLGVTGLLVLFALTCVALASVTLIARSPGPSTTPVRSLTPTLEQSRSTQPKITWSQDHLDVILLPGESLSQNLTFTSSLNLQNIVIQAVPAIGRFISVEPSGLATVPANQPQTVGLRFSIPFGATPGTHGGTIHVRTGSRTLPQTLKVSITVSSHFSISGFGDNGAGWTLNGHDFVNNPTPATVSSDVLHITDVTGYFEARSAFFGSRLPIGQFAASFTYQNLTAPGTGGGPFGGLFNPGDGVVFTIENQGTTALGDCCGQLGYYGISNASGVALHIFSTPGYIGNVPGTGYAPTAVPAPGGTGLYLDTSPVNLVSGHPINVTLIYDGTTLTEELADAITHDQFSTTYLVDIPGAVGSSRAFVGFTGGTGAGASDQRVSNFQFTPM